MATILASAIDEWRTIVTACKPNRVEKLPGGQSLIRIHVVEGQDVATVIKRCEAQLAFFHGQEEKEWDNNAER